MTGLIADKTQPGFPSSIAVTGMAITAYIVGVEKKYLTRANAVERILKFLDFFMIVNKEQKLMLLAIKDSIIIF